MASVLQAQGGLVEALYSTCLGMGMPTRRTYPRFEYVRLAGGQLGFSWLRPVLCGGAVAYQLSPQDPYDGTSGGNTILKKYLHVYVQSLHKACVQAGYFHDVELV